LCRSHAGEKLRGAFGQQQVRERLRRLTYHIAARRQRRFRGAAFGLDRRDDAIDLLVGITFEVFAG
jgi:hypothetical protein